MSTQARVDSIDQLKIFRTQMVKFAEQAMVALADSEGEVQRVMMWLETEANTHWSNQIRKRHEVVEKCKDAVRQKKLFKSPSGSTQSAVEEEKALRIAQKRFEEAEEKLKNVRRYTPRLQKEISIYKGGVQRLATTVSSDLPVAISRLDRMCAALEAYAAMQVSGGGGDDSGELFQRMARAMGDMGDGGGAQPANYKPLRDKTMAVDRKNATPGDVRLEQWMAGPLHEKERETFSKITSDRNALPMSDTVIVEAGAWDAGKIYLERIKLDDDVTGDTGWYLGKADGEKGDGDLSMPLSALIQGRPDLQEALTLPVGYLVVMDMTSVMVILDEKGKDVWGPIK